MGKTDNTRDAMPSDFLRLLRDGVEAGFHIIAVDDGCGIILDDGAAYLYFNDTELREVE